LTQVKLIHPCRPGEFHLASFLRALIFAPTVILAAQAPAPVVGEAPPRDPAPPLPKEILNDPKVIARGEEIWKEQCSHCHGSKAYPGKAPRLQPKQYTPDFVWDRVHNGFRGMPTWKDVYSPDDVNSVVAWVMSEDFFP
jgi:mono/diheme cytochrome c family protein